MQTYFSYKQILFHCRDGKISKDYWEFYPGGAITNKLCGSSDGEFALNFAPLESSRFTGITSRHIVVKDNYAVYFKVLSSQLINLQDCTTFLNP